MIFSCDFIEEERFTLKTIDIINDFFMWVYLLLINNKYYENIYWLLIRYNKFKIYNVFIL